LNNAGIPGADAADPHKARVRLATWLSAQKSTNTLLVSGVIVLAGLLRFWNFGSLGYQQWDEYWYIRGARSVGLFWPKGWRDITYAIAPLASYTDGTLFHFFGVHNWMPLAVSATYGTLAAAALYFLGSRMFGNAVGLIAAAILATAEFSIMYSREAIADATFNFWLIASVLFIWLGFTRRRLRYWLLAGLCSGLLLNAKYDGAYPLILASSWLVCEFLVEVAVRRRPFLSKAWSEYRPHVVGVIAMIAVAVLLFSPWLLKLNQSPGFQTFLGVHGHYFGAPTPPIFILWFFWVFTSPPTLLLALAGVAIGAVRFTRADRLMLIYTAGWFLAVILFDPYPRESLTLLPAVGIWAGRAVIELWKLLGSAGRTPRRATAVAAAFVAAMLLAQLVPLPAALSLRTQGYKDAAAVTDRYQASGGVLFVRCQTVELLYLRRYPHYVATQNSIRAFAPSASAVYFMTDQTLSSYPDLVDFFMVNQDHMQVLARVPNPLFRENLLQPATEDKLKGLDDPPDSFRFITIWRMTGPALYPSSWTPPPA
jgi:4-amino-4-deoxy-L-arabinose transferase-like glycosyltransferase